MEPLDFRIPPHLLAYELNVLSRSLREEGNMQISEGILNPEPLGPAHEKTLGFVLYKYHLPQHSF